MNDVVIMFPMRFAPSQSRTRSRNLFLQEENSVKQIDLLARVVVSHVVLVSDEASLPIHGGSIGIHRFEPSVKSTGYPVVDQRLCIHSTSCVSSAMSQI